MINFKIHCSQIAKIMGRIGLTDSQATKMLELSDRKKAGAKPLTAIMEAELTQLSQAHLNPKLPETATAFLKEWYAGDREPIFNKYLDKGNYVEADLIDYMAEMMGFGLAEKNQETKSDDYLIGTCDVEYAQLVVDVKAPWNRTTLQQNIEKIDPDYEWQLRGYMKLWDKPEALLFYGLMDTPAEVNYDNEIIYSVMPDPERWIAYKIARDISKEAEIVRRVQMCREWLNTYDMKVKSKMGKVHVLFGEVTV